MCVRAPRSMSPLFTSADWNPLTAAREPGPTALEMKQAWWRQTISEDTFNNMPNYRATFLFEFVKEAEDIKGAVIDYGGLLEEACGAGFMVVRWRYCGS